MKENEAKELVKLLGLDKPMDPDVIKLLFEAVKEIGDKVGDENAEEARDTIDKAMDSLKDNQTKAMIISYLLSKLPLELTNFLMENMKELVMASTLSNITGGSEDDSIQSKLLELMKSN
ncbi:hypothetical protein [uncultured phage cr106_1]|uniref:Uncharacterized protein n=1 Tax=uncultured phage cr106_1 TaxID=2772062 RepID=A0A7M1RWR0_9CAUD|nr:hypothetical protein KNV29_gp086 [uncultured phage cr106_1]QOR58301.1 hypothetical protein [uncultured phage cr106_1]